MDFTCRDFVNCVKLRFVAPYAANLGKPQSHSFASKLQHPQYMIERNKKVYSNLSLNNNKGLSDLAKITNVHVNSLNVNNRRKMSFYSSFQKLNNLSLFMLINPLNVNNRRKNSYSSFLKLNCSC